jgi:hypothetical protein
MGANSSFNFNEAFTRQPRNPLTLENPAFLAGRAGSLQEMKTTINNNHTREARRRNKLRAHTDGSFSIRIDGKWSRKLRELSQTQFLSLLKADRERLVLREFHTGRSLTGCPVIVSRPLSKEVAR